MFEEGIKWELHPDVAGGPVWVWLTVSRAWRTGKWAKRDEKGNHVVLGRSRVL